MAMAHSVIRGLPIVPLVGRRSTGAIRCEMQAMKSASRSTATESGAQFQSSRRRSLVLGLTIAAAAAVGAAATQFQFQSAIAEEQQIEYTTAASGLGYCDTVVGSGDPIPKGTLIKAHYTGKLLDGTVFDSSYNRRKPLTFKLGVGEVIKGWDEGILGGGDVPPMLPGGKRKLKIPSNLGYGGRGAGCRGGSCVIPPNSVLLFDVELIGKA